jgi:hypothetical protein
MSHLGFWEAVMKQMEDQTKLKMDKDRAGPNVLRDVTAS